MNTFDRARLAVLAFAVVVIAWGASGIFATNWWIVHVFGLHLDTMPDLARVTFRNEFRFLEAREIGVGLYALFFRGEIATIRKHRAVFLLMVAVAPLARLYSVLVDGAPNHLWLLFMACEWAMAAAIYLATRASIAKTQVAVA